MKAAAIELKEVGFGYQQSPLFHDLSLSLIEGRIYSLVGASGSGKTSLLQIMNGLLIPQTGQVHVLGQVLSQENSIPIRRRMGYVLQGSGLFPHMTVMQNMGLIARSEGWTQKQIRQRAEELCHLLSLPPSTDFLNRRPQQLSGGQQQRVGLARALFLSPQIILMDEPLSALDPVTRQEIQIEIIRLQKQLGLTLVIVTHDLAEAFFLSDELLVLQNGRIVQRGRPNQILLHPTNGYVADFVRSHSPGKRLREIALYSLMNSRIWVSRPDFQVLNLETGQTRHFSGLAEMKNFLTQEAQTTLYWVDSAGCFLKAEDLHTGKILPQVTGKAADHLLQGLQLMFHERLAKLPLLNEQGQLVGVLSEGALNAL